MLNLCTYFDSRYLIRGLALYESLERTTKDFVLWVLCLDDQTERVLTALRKPHLKIVPLRELEAADGALSHARRDRSLVEFYWTCTPALLLYLLSSRADLTTLIYVDADMWFFGDASVAVREMGDGSVLLVPHDYAPEYKSHETAGIYNVGLMVFRHDEAALEALTWWRARCLEWCYDRHEDGKMGDQGYLNDWTERFSGIRVCAHAGLKAAPWNVSAYQAARDGQGNLTLAAKPLVCFHFHGLRFCVGSLAFLIGSHVGLTDAIKEAVYRPYLRTLLSLERDSSLKESRIRIPRTGIPWRYIGGRAARLEPVRHFMWLGGPQS